MSWPTFEVERSWGPRFRATLIVTHADGSTEEVEWIGQGTASGAPIRIDYVFREGDRLAFKGIILDMAR